MKKAFSLIELMIVIVIIGVVYTLAISKLQNVSEKKIEPTLSTLKEYLYSFIKDDAKEARYLCLDDCSKCSIYVDGEKKQTQESFFDDTIETYTYDSRQGLIEKKDELFFDEEQNQEDVCFSFKVDKNDIADQVIVVYKERAYDYSSYFSKTVVYDSIEEAVNQREKLAQEVMQ